MHRKQREFFEDSRRYTLCLGIRHGRTQYANAIKEGLARQAEKRNASPIAEQGKPLQGIDECKEVTAEDCEKIRQWAEKWQGQGIDKP